MSNGPTDFAEYITPERAYELNKVYKEHHSLKTWRRMAQVRGFCEVCRENPIWRYGGTGMCFSCTTGEADASSDYELVQP